MGDLGMESAALTSAHDTFESAVESQPATVAPAEVAPAPEPPPRPGGEPVPVPVPELEAIPEPRPASLSEPATELPPRPAGPPLEDQIATRLGPLLAVSGLCGGAGATTLACLVARRAVRRSERPVLLCDTGGPTGGLAAQLGLESPRTLIELANAVGEGAPLDGPLFVEAERGLRLLAGGPRLDRGAHAGGLVRLLGDARRAHDLTVIDCGVPARRCDQRALELATHVAWVLPASAGGIARARRVLDVLPSDPRRHDLLVARKDPAVRKPPMRELTQLAERRRAPLVLMPAVSRAGTRGEGDRLDLAAVTLDAIEALLRR
jgi:hypothetical protein